MSEGTTVMRTMWISASALLVVLCLSAGAMPSSAGAEFGIANFEVAFTNQDGSPARQAGSHPYAMTTTIAMNETTNSDDEPIPDGAVKDIVVQMPAGLVGNPGATSRCSTVDFATVVGATLPSCQDNSVVGFGEIEVIGKDNVFFTPVYNLKAPPGLPAELGFVVAGIPITIDVGVRSSGDLGLTASLVNISQAVSFYSSSLTIWGNPADSVHDPVRGSCLDFRGSSKGDCPTSGESKAFLTLPRSCTGPMTFTMTASSWEVPGSTVGASTTTDGMLGCHRLGFAPATSALPTTDRSEAPTGLDFTLEVEDEGLVSPTGLAQSESRAATVRLPSGLTINPSVAEGLGVCTPADYVREAVTSDPGAGCPNSSKIGSVSVETPLLDESLSGSLFIAQQDDPGTNTSGAENPFDSLLAMYLVIKNPGLGIMVKAEGKVSPRPADGQLTTTFIDLPQLPFNRFELDFREGQRAPLVSPPRCGTFVTEADLSPWSDPGRTLLTTSTFDITRGVDGGLCPSGANRGFAPGLSAGTLNNNAGSFSPVSLRMTRNDGEQEITSFSAKLPPGLVGKLAGVATCSDGAIEAAKLKTGTQENVNQSCPAASQVGHSLAGAGVGSVLAYAPGKVYLAGPYKGSPLSIAAITSATVGPFDLGTVVIRSALRIDPETARVSVDAAGSDPIPHILKGIQLHLRDIRVNMARPSFTLNPTSCDPLTFAATLTGSGPDLANASDDVLAGISNPFQAANCAMLAFKPKLSMRLIGGMRRNAHPRFRAVLQMPDGNANIARAAVTLPSSQFLENDHIRTVCTRPQFAAESCPPGSVYGRARAFTPLLDQPLEGPVYLRSSSNKLPDMVAALDGQIDIDLIGRIDSKNGGIRTTFDSVPDAPVTKFVLNMQGGKKGLLVNSENLCGRRWRANVKFDGQNGKTHDFKPVVRSGCGKRKRAKRHGSSRSRASLEHQSGAG